MSSSSEEEDKKKQDESGSDDSDSSSDESENIVEKQDPLKLAPPTFSLPIDSDDFEVWTIRMPFNVDHTALDGIQLSLDKGRKQLGSILSRDEKYGIVSGEPFETESIRILVEDEGEFMKLADVPTSRHLNIVHADGLKVIPETKNAPGVERAPKAVDPVRKAYAVVPQVAGLKRRWMPTGAPATKEKSQTAKAQKFVTGFADFHTLRAKKAAADAKEASTMKSPKAKKKRSGDAEEETPDSKAISDSDTDEEEKKKKKRSKKDKKEKKDKKTVKKKSKV